MISFPSETIRRYQNHMSDVCVFRDASQWHHVINLVTHPVPIHPTYGPVIHEAELRTQVKLWNKTCPPDKTAESLFVNRGQNLFLWCLFHAQDASMSPTFTSLKKKKKGGMFKYVALFVKLTGCFSLCLQPFKKEKSNKKKKKACEMRRLEGHRAAGIWWLLL